MTTYDEIPVPPDTDWPIRDTSHLMRRISALDEAAQDRLAEAWQGRGWGNLEPLVTSDQYKAYEEAVAICEPGALGDEAWQRLNAVAEVLYAQPEPIQSACTESLAVYAGIGNPRNLLISTWARIAEAERIVSEAVVYAAANAADGGPRVADLPPADDTAALLLSDVYPGTKADAKTIEAWVRRGADETAVLNRAARAYALEQDRATARKRLSAKLIEILGPDGLAKVQGAIEAAAPPPLNLGSTLADGAESGAAGTGDSPSPAAPADGTAPPSAAEAEPAAPIPLEAPLVTDALIAALHHFVHLDEANAAIHCSSVRFSPITFRLAEALVSLNYKGNDDTVLVLGHLGSYEEDRGR